MVYSKGPLIFRLKLAHLLMCIFNSANFKKNNSFPVLFIDSWVNKIVFA